MSNLFGLSHIAQLAKIQDDRRSHRRPGIGAEVEELIRRLTSGVVPGKTDDVRMTQAKRYWDLGVGKKLGKTSFEAYLADIPEIPAELAEDDADYPLLILIEPRLGLRLLCKLGDIMFSGEDYLFPPCDERHREFAHPTWIRLQDGRKNRGRCPTDCRASFAKDELGLTALQGVCHYLMQYPEWLADMAWEGALAMYLLGSVPVDGHRFTMFIDVFDGGQAKLSYHGGNGGDPRFGAASRRECKVA